MKRHLPLLLATMLLNNPLAFAADNEISTRVVGGEESAEGDWPWMVVVQAAGYECGGTLINETTVLTAAHCLHDERGNIITAPQITAIVGEYDRSTPFDGTNISVSQTYIHDGYDAANNSSGNDIALLRLSTSVNNITPINRVDSATSNSAIANNSDALTLGWGSIVGYASGEFVIPIYPDALHQVALPLQTDSQCARAYFDYDASTMLCAGKLEGGVDSCQGDSGGPLIINNGGSWEQIGIVSWGAGCAQPGSPGVYTRVASYAQWIATFEDQVSINNPLTFTGTAVDSSETRALVISNNAPIDVQLNFTLSGASTFTFASNTCATINAKSSCSLPITYSPISTVSSKATLTIDSDLSGTSPISTTLSGTPAFSVSTSSGGGGAIWFIFTLPLLWLRRYLS